MFLSCFAKALGTFFERKTIAFAPNNLAPTDIEIPWFPALAVTKVTPLNVFLKFSNETSTFAPKRE